MNFVNLPYYLIFNTKLSRMSADCSRSLSVDRVNIITVALGVNFSLLNYKYNDKGDFLTKMVCPIFYKLSLAGYRYHDEMVQLFSVFIK